jgi:hypothetical protein
MNKLIITFVLLPASAILGCHSNTATDTKAVQPKSTPKATLTIKSEHNDVRKHIDQMTFVKYQDDGDYFQLLARKGDSTISFINETDTSRNLNRGDRIQVAWKYGTITLPGDNDSEMAAQMLLSVKKIGEGPVSHFRKSYGRKLKYTWATDEEFTSSYLNKVYLLTEYYLTQTKNSLLQLAIKNRDELTYSIESKERDGRSYKVIGIAPVGPNGSNVMQWLYIDEESDKIYDYNLPEDKLIEVN